METCGETKNLSDEKLYQLCREYGERALELRRKFIGLLPEVQRRVLYKKKGFLSIFEFAAKLAGVSREQVQAVIRVSENFENMPILKEALVSGEVSVNKLVRLIPVATAENQEFLVDQVKLLSSRAVEVMVRDMKKNMKEVQQKFLHVQESKNQNGLFERKTVGESVYHRQGGAGVNTLERMEKLSKLELSDEVIEKLAELKNKGLDVNAMILGFLEKREQEIEEKKTEIAVEIEKREERERWLWYLGFRSDGSGGLRKMKAGRYVSVKVRKILKEEYGNRCAVPGCGKEAAEIHHAARFGLTGVHDPRFMAPMCREHHAIAHSLDVKWVEKREAGV